MTWFALKGNVTGELLSFHGGVLIHNSKEEYEWLFPRFSAVPLKGATPQDVADGLQRRVMLIQDHPDMASVRFPLDKRDFVDTQVRS